MAGLSRSGLLDGQKKLEFYEHYVFGKRKRVRFLKERHDMKKALEYIHSDLWGSARVLSRRGAYYLMMVIDDCFRKVWVFFLKQKNDVFGTFKKWKTLAKKQTGK